MHYHCLLRHALLLCPLLALASCAGTAPPAAQAPGPAAPVTAASERAPRPMRAFPKVSYVRGHTSLDQAVRYIGEAYGGGIVSILGVDVRAVPPMERERVPFESFVDELAKAVDCVWIREPDYYLILPEGYEILLDTRIPGGLPARFESPTLDFAFGFNTKLYDIFASLGHSLGLAIVTDNILGEQRVGEMNVPTTPLPAALEAILRSARVAPGGFTVECTEEYLFLLAATNQSLPSPLLNAASLSPAAVATLDRVVHVALPVPPPDAERIAFNRATLPLEAVLPSLSSQLGIAVAASPEVRDLPVNPCVLPGVRVRTALDLLVRQWPLPHYGYEVLDDRILIRPVQ
jgi:hypothetical protein